MSVAPPPTGRGRSAASTAPRVDQDAPAERTAGRVAAPADDTRAAETERRRHRRPTTTILVTAVLVVAAVYFLVPVYWVLVAATKSTDELFTTSGFWFSGSPQLFSNIGTVLTFDGGIFLRWLLNSFLYSGVGAVLATYLAAAAGYALGMYDFKGNGLIHGVVLGGVLVPATATALPLFLLFSQVGLANTYWGVLIPSLVSPFGVFLCRIYSRAAVPVSVVEAARIDGAGELRIFHVLALRAMAPALVTVLLFQTIAIWNNYLLPLVMLADSRLYPATLGLTTWRGQVDRLPEFYQLTIGGVLVSVVPLVILMIVLQRFWRGGLTEGAVKA